MLPSFLLSVTMRALIIITKMSMIKLTYSGQNLRLNSPQKVFNLQDSIAIPNKLLATMHAHLRSALANLVPWLYRITPILGWGSNSFIFGEAKANRNAQGTSLINRTKYNNNESLIPRSQLRINQPIRSLVLSTNKSYCLAPQKSTYLSKDAHGCHHR